METRARERHRIFAWKRKTDRGMQKGNRAASLEGTAATRRRGSQDLPRAIARRIIKHVLTHGLKPGAHLTANSLADTFAVSRSPVRKALLHLEELNAVESKPNRGFFLLMRQPELRKLAELIDVAKSDQEPHILIARDRLAGLLPHRLFTESQLMRRYDLSRRELQVILAQMAREGWVERQPGYGWAFQPMLTSPDTYPQCYRFRMAIEPTAILEASFKPDEAAFARARRAQKSLLDANFRRLTWAQIFEAGAEFHETICACSGNPFFLQGLRQANRLLSLYEYRKEISEAKFRNQIQEHLAILSMIEDDKRDEAAEAMRRHLASSPLPSPHPPA